jgi:RNA polymerase sigma-70 factor (ECF subfamily)
MSPEEILPRTRRREGTEADDLVTALYQEHGPKLLAFTTRLTSGDRQWAEDVVQETLLRAWRSAISVDDTQPPARAWLFTVARRVVLDGYRRRSARPKEVGDGALELLQDDDQVDRMLSALAVSDALASISASHRAALDELYYKGRTAEAAAAELGIPIGTVKSRSYYALKALRLALEERGLTPLR